MVKTDSTDVLEYYSDLPMKSTVEGEDVSVLNNNGPVNQYLDAFGCIFVVADITGNTTNFCVTELYNASDNAYVLNSIYNFSLEFVITKTNNYLT